MIGCKYDKTDNKENVGNADVTPICHLYSLGKLPWYRKGARLYFFYTPRLGLPSIAAATPPDWDVRIFDGISEREIDFDASIDLAGFSVLTPFAAESYAAADRFRHKGVKVVMGGVHPSLVPEEAKAHADAVIIGEAEEIWPVLLRDMQNERLLPYYRPSDRPAMETLPDPKFSAVRNPEDYHVANAIQLVRGCPHGGRCAFCVVPELFGRRPRALPVATAVNKIIALREERNSIGVNVSACCPLNHTEYISDFAEAVKPLGIEWCGAGLPDRLNDDALLEKLRAGGCTLIYVESAVVSPRKDRKLYLEYCAATQKMRAHGIGLSYNFTVGFDDDDKHVFEDVLEFIERNELRRELCAVQLFAPWPGTPAFRALDREGRIVDRDWTHYDNTRAVFKPKRMTIEEFNPDFGLKQSPATSGAGHE